MTSQCAKQGAEVALPTRGGSRVSRRKHIILSVSLSSSRCPQQPCSPLMWLLSNPNTHLHSLMLQLLARCPGVGAALLHTEQVSLRSTRSQILHPLSHSQVPVLRDKKTLHMIPLGLDDCTVLIRCYGGLS